MMKKKLIKISNENQNVNQSKLQKENLRQRKSVSFVLPNIQRNNQKQQSQFTHFNQNILLKQLKINNQAEFIVKKCKSLNKNVFSVIENKVRNQNQPSNNSSMNITKKIKFLKLQNKLIQKEIINLCQQSSFDDNSKQKKHVRNVSLFSQKKQKHEFQKINKYRLNKKSSKQISKKMLKNQSSTNVLEQYAQKYLYFYENLSKKQHLDHILSMSTSQVQKNKQKKSIKNELQKFSILDDMKKYYIKKKQRMPSILANIQFSSINQTRA